MKYIGLIPYLDETPSLNVNAHYLTETTVPSDAMYHALMSIVSSRLKGAEKAASDLKSKSMGTNNSIPNGAMSVKDRAKLYEENTPQKLMAKQSELNEKVIFYRRWLSRQGAQFRGADNIDHALTKGRIVSYDSDLAKQGASRVQFDGGLFKYENDVKRSYGTKMIVDTSKMVTMCSGPGKAIFVLSQQKHLHIGSHKVGRYHHSSLLAGSPVACAGELEISNGKLVWISNKSGHYQPTRNDFLHVLAILQDHGVPMQFKVTYFNGNKPTPYNDISDFLEAESLDNKTIEAIASSKMALNAAGYAYLAGAASMYGSPAYGGSY